MKIGITERGDASVDMSWAGVGGLSGYAGAILITKSITDDFIENVLGQTKPIIVHATCTGWGGTKMEPGVPEYKTQLNQLKKLIDLGFPASRCVLRVDPIIPTDEGLDRVKSVLDYFISLDTGVTRVRVSLVDEYRHVKSRYMKNGVEPAYGCSFYPYYYQIAQVSDLLRLYDSLKFETCAEDRLASMTVNVRSQGCVDLVDLDLMNIPHCEGMYRNPQGRSGCHCLSVKSELLSLKSSAKCPHNCLYCYWKRPGE